ncbi:Gfo/Idh/MocA family protein [Solirhodobacter olei]|uniref:Gfo/Idh/MocA family protein n=1 Tax=Solirhodobacter olei TaxID=2493082 RepID=UPI000FD70602|nr:Gfo/Idh/MocA family oxidoreductase [Solirhodobacter olei]
MRHVSIVGTGYVADLYMQSLATFSDISVRAAFDRNPERLAAFCRHWKVPPADGLAQLLEDAGIEEVILNLTNPDSHFEVSSACLAAGHHVYSEKPLAMEMEAARTLHRIAGEKGLLLASAPCSVLGKAAQTLWKAVRDGRIGRPLLVYAELDDGFISQAPYRQWVSASGAPWPFADEFRVGCTVEHAGYYLTWLIAMFGPVRSVTAASAVLDETKLGNLPTAPDFSVAVLFFDHGVTARLTCSIIARHDHAMRIVGEAGTLEVGEAWDNSAPVRLRRRRRVRRRLIEMPFTRRIRFGEATGRKVARFGSASMNFALGPAEMLDAISEGRPCRLTADLALHLNEVTLAIQQAGSTTGTVRMTTDCAPLEPMSGAMGQTEIRRG